MKILSKIILLIMITLMIFTLTHINKINTFASSNLNVANKKVVNIAVLFYRLDDPFYLKLKQSFDDIQKENQDKVKFNFFDSKDNEAIQDEILDSLIRSNADLFIVFSVNRKESTIENIINKVKQKNVSLILSNVDPQTIPKVSKYYGKVAFVGTDIEKSGSEEGKILVNLWNSNKNLLDKNQDNILQYVLLQGQSSSPITNERTRSSISAINNLGIKTESLAIINGNWSRELAKNAINSLFLKYDNKIEAIIANNDDMAIGAIEALQSYGY